MTPKTVLMLALAACLALSPQATAEDIFPFPVHQHKLDNGLSIVAVPYDSPGTVAYITLIRTGSRDEVEPGHSGFAHFFEHMMFRGTERFSRDAYAQILKRMGADSNAFTSDDRTQYYIIGPAAELETMMEIESDRFKNLKYAEDGFKTEALAVLGEYNKNASNPFLPMWEKMRDLAFEKHTYKHTTLGFLADIKAMPGYFEYSLGFFSRYYRPDNAVLLVVGDIQPDRLFKLAEKYYGDWQSGFQAPKIQTEPEQTAQKVATLAWPAPIRPHLMTGFRAPAFSDTSPDTATLDIISQLLFSESAPLYQKLVVDEQWVDFISGSYSDHRDPFLFVIFARVKSEELMEKVQAEISDHIADLQKNLAGGARLDRIKSFLRYQFALSLDSPGSVASTISGVLNMTGDPASVNRVYDQYQKVTPADVQRIARLVFQPNRETRVTLRHTPTAPTPPASAPSAAAQGGLR